MIYMCSVISMKGGTLMTIYTFPLNSTSNIKLWSIQGETAIVQYCSPEKKSRKTTCKIKEYNGKKYVTCLGHRYYLDKFQKIDI